MGTDRLSPANVRRRSGEAEELGEGFALNSRPEHRPDTQRLCVPGARSGLFAELSGESACRDVRVPPAEVCSKDARSPAHGLQLC